MTQVTSKSGSFFHFYLRGCYLDPKTPVTLQLCQDCQNQMMECLINHSMQSLQLSVLIRGFLPSVYPTDHPSPCRLSSTKRL